MGDVEVWDPTLSAPWAPIVLDSDEEIASIDHGAAASEDSGKADSRESRLPDELWGLIFGLLSPEERFLAKQTCRSWAHIIRVRRAWKFERISARYFLLNEKLFFWQERELRKLPLSRLLLVACQGETSAPFFRMVATMRRSLNPDVISECAGRTKNEEIKKWCEEWETPLEDIRLFEAAKSGSPKSTRLALRSGAVLVDWALSGAVCSGHTRSAIQLLKKGARDWSPDRLTLSSERQLSPDQLKAVRACSKWTQVVAA